MFPSPEVSGTLAYHSQRDEASCIFGSWPKSGNIKLISIIYYAKETESPPPHHHHHHHHRQQQHQQHRHLITCLMHASLRSTNQPTDQPAAIPPWEPARTMSCIPKWWIPATFQRVDWLGSFGTFLEDSIPIQQRMHSATKIL